MGWSTMTSIVCAVLAASVVLGAPSNRNPGAEVDREPRTAMGKGGKSGKGGKGGSGWQLNVDVDQKRIAALASPSGITKISLEYVGEVAGAPEGSAPGGKAKKGGKGLAGVTEQGLEWRVEGDVASFPSPDARVSANAGPFEPISVGGTYSVTPGGDGVVGDVTIRLGENAQQGTTTTHTVQFHAGCNPDGSGLQVGDSVGPFKVQDLSTSACPAGTARGCGLEGCLAPAAQTEAKQLQADEAIPEEPTTTVATKAIATEPIATEPSTVLAKEAPATTADPADVIVDFGIAVQIAWGATGTTDATTDKEFSVCFPVPAYTVAVADIITIDGANYIVQAVSPSGPSSLCIDIVKHTAGDLAACTDTGGCDVFLHTQVLAGTFDPTDDAGTLDRGVADPNGQTSQEDGGVASSEKSQQQVCTFELYAVSNTECTGAPTERINMTTSVGYLTQVCTATTVGGADSTAPLFLTAHADCKTDDAAQAWTMCSWQPDTTSSICSATNQQCCNHVGNATGATDPPSLDLACQQYTQGECSTIYGFDGVATFALSARLVGCEGTPPADPQCATTPSVEPHPLIDHPAAGLSFIFLFGLIVLAVAMFLRHSRLAVAHIKEPLDTDPLISTAVPNQDYWSTGSSQA